MCTVYHIENTGVPRKKNELEAKLLKWRHSSQLKVQIQQELEYSKFQNNRLSIWRNFYTILEWSCIPWNGTTVSWVMEAEKSVLIQPSPTSGSWHGTCLARTGLVNRSSANLLPSIQEVGTEGLGVQGHPWLKSLAYMRYCLKEGIWREGGEEQKREEGRRRSESQSLFGLTETTEGSHLNSRYLTT